MVSLFNLFVNDRYKPKSPFASKVTANNKGKQSKKNEPFLAAVTESAKKVR